MRYDETRFRKVDDGYLYFAGRRGTYRVTEAQVSAITAISTRMGVMTLVPMLVALAVGWWFGRWPMIGLVLISPVPYALYAQISLNRLLKQAPRSNEALTPGEVFRIKMRLTPWWFILLLLCPGVCGTVATAYLVSTSRSDILVEIMFLTSCVWNLAVLFVVALKLRYEERA